MIEIKQYEKFRSGKYSFSWLYDYGMSKKGRIKQSVTEVLHFPCDQKLSVRDESLQRNVVKLLMLYGFVVGETFHNVQPGNYEFNLRARFDSKKAPCQHISAHHVLLSRNMNGYIKHQTRMSVSWRDGLSTQSFGEYGSIETQIPQSSKTEVLLISPQGWEQLATENGEQWFDLTLKNINIKKQTNVDFEFHYDSSYSQSVLYLDYIELRDTSIV